MVNAAFHGGGYFGRGRKRSIYQARIVSRHD